MNLSNGQKFDLIDYVMKNTDNKLLSNQLTFELINSLLTKGGVIYTEEQYNMLMEFVSLENGG